MWQDRSEISTRLSSTISEQAKEGQFALEKEYVLYPLNCETIIQVQDNIQTLIETAKSNRDYSVQPFYRVDK